MQDPGRHVSGASVGHAFVDDGPPTAKPFREPPGPRRQRVAGEQVQHRRRQEDQCVAEKRNVQPQNHEGEQQREDETQEN